MTTATIATPSPTLDVAGTSIEIGDTVVTVNGQSTGKVIEIKPEDDIHFIRLRPAHQSYGKGVWYASDQVFWVARPGSAKKTDPKPASKPGNSPPKTASAPKPAAVSARSAPAKKK